MVAGCGTSTLPQLAVISVTGYPAPAAPASPVPISSVAINNQAGLSVSLGQNSENLAVNWSLSCEGSPFPVPNPAPSGYKNPDPNPCGTLSNSYGTSTVFTAPPLQPVGNSVTITAIAASDPSIASSVNLPIVPLPITIAFSVVPPAALGVNGTQVLSATVTNDANAAGVNWTLSCGSTGTACGSLQSGLPNPTQTASTGQIIYTAPAAIPPGGVVTIIATSVTDPTKSVNTAITIEPISISVTTPTITVPIGTTANLTALVAFDSANLGVDWVAPACGSPGACGSLSSTHTASGASVVYTPPSSIPLGSTVTVVAKSTANPAATATVTITVAPPPPIVVSVSPGAATVQVNGTLQLTGTTTYDQANAGLDWTPGGSLTSPHTASYTASGYTDTFTNTYTAPSAVPAGGTVTVTATSTAAPVTDPTRTASATITVVPAISIAFTPALPASVTAGSAYSFTATVTNEIAPGGVDWSCNTPSYCPSGSFSPSHTASGAATKFTAPASVPAGSIKIIATSTASNTALPVRSVSATVTVAPVIAVNFVPYAPSQMQVSNVVNGVATSAPIGLSAAVTNDTTNAGVDWSACGSTSSSQVSCGGAAACGLFQITPAMAATSTTAAVNAVCAATVHTNSGQAALYIPPSQGGTVTITAKADNPAATSPLAKATATVNIAAQPSGVPLSGVVMAGTAHPVSGASVSLYAAGTTGYGSAASALEISGSATQVVTTATGQFTIPAGYTCPSQSSQMYLVALGGNAGGGINPNLAMMTALGPCGGLSSTANITINEVTTIASVWALAPFMSDYAHIGSSSANATVGMANAFAAVNNLVNIQTGQALATTPAGNGTVPQAEIDTLADVLDSCAVTAGGAVGDGSPCGVLFGDTNPTTATNTAPVDMLRAALNIALSPQGVGNQNNGTFIYALLPANRPYLPVLATAPNDWSISLSFSGGGLGSQSFAIGFAIDALGDIWTANNGYNSVTELNSLGAALSPPGTATGGFQDPSLNTPDAIAIDPLGNAWIVNDVGSLTELSPYGIGLSGSAGYTGGGLTNPKDGMAIDGKGNVWTVSYSPDAVSWFAGANATINGVPTPPGTPLSPSSGYTQGVSKPTGAIGVDTFGTVWVLNTGNNSAAEFSSSTGSFIQSDFGYQLTVPPPPSLSVLLQGPGRNLAIDNAGDVYLPTGNPPEQLSELQAGGSSSNFGGTGAVYPSIQSQYAQFLALDGAGHIWVLVTGSYTCISGASTLDSVVELNGSGVPLNTNSTGCGYRANGLGPSNDAIAVDGSGDVWILSYGSVTEFIGVATPVVTPFSLGVQNKTLGKKP
jgi:hypothetical protein